MKNLALNNEVVPGKVYMVEMKNGEVSSYRILSDTPSYYILSFSKDGSFEVFEKAKGEVLGIYEVVEWGNSQETIQQN
ncbi:hypothetical protein [Neobacillus fumarioli]|uniref:hypothetical protein n=1 Tax=Neobacillus fumarioli TaxID=105229 RepID=UPI000832730B|nr:hypothetical protein [Neobacillus fumarioli]